MTGVQTCALPISFERVGGSLNDAYVAALLGGLRRYHERFDVELDELPMAMPVSLRKANDPMGGNKFAGALFAAPIGIVDPAERIATVRGIVLSVRVEPAINFMTLAAPVMNRMPRALAGLVYARAGSLADLSASNVPGSPEPGYLAGARVERVYPFGPLPGVAVMATMVSHGGVCCVGINADGTAIADPDLLMTCLQAGLDEVLELSKETL